MVGSRRFQRTVAAIIAGLALLAPGPDAQAKPTTPPAAKKPAPKKQPAPKPGARPAGKPPATWHPPAPAAVEPPRPLTLDLPVDKTTLANGLRVVLNPDQQLPSVAVAVAYAAGSRHEAADQEGFARAAAKAMASPALQGTAGQTLQRLADTGASFETMATQDLVVFADRVPSSALEFVVWLEAQRLRTAKVTDAVLELQRRELRARDAAQLAPEAPGRLQPRLDQIVFEGYWPYQHDAAGGTGLMQATAAQTQAFLHTFYAPNNAVLAISGAFDPDQALAAVHRYFDPLAANSSLPVLNPAPLPDQTSQRSTVLSSEQPPMFAYGWAAPAVRQPEHDALVMAVHLLAGGGDARLPARFAKAKVPVTYAMSIDERRGPSLVMLCAQAPSEPSLIAARKLIDEELDALARLGPTTEEMRALWRGAQAEYLDGLSTHATRATKLASFELMHGDARLVHADLTRRLSINKDDIRKAVARLLSPARRSVVQATASGSPLQEPAVPKPGAAAQVPGRAPAPHAAPAAHNRKPAAAPKPPPKKKKK